MIRALAAVDAAKPAPEARTPIRGDRVTYPDGSSQTFKTAEEAIKFWQYQNGEPQTGLLKPAPEAVEPLRAELTELVACIDWVETGAGMSRDEYRRREPLAWEAARAALSHSAPETLWIGPEGQEMPSEVYAAWSVNNPERAKLYQQIKAAPETAPVEAGALTDEPTSGDVWQHLKSGHNYVIVCVAKLESRPHHRVVVYRDVEFDRAEPWVRSLAEFMDGRFVNVLE
jgi:hypothetical protein